MSYLGAFIIASRVKTLVAGLIPCIVGTALAYATLKNSQHIHYSLSFLALFSAIFIQIATNFINDALDFTKGTDTSARIGPKRMAQSGMLSTKELLYGSLLCFIISALLAIPLILHAGISILILGCLSILCAYLYTGTRYALAYLGLGELFVILFFGFGAVCGVYYIHTLTISISSIIASCQIGLLAAVLIAINNLRDYTEDKLANKRTLAVRWGINFARYEIVILIAIAYLLNLYWLFTPYIRSGIFALCSIPLALKIIFAILNINSVSADKLNRYLSLSALLQLIFGLFLSLGFII